MGSRKITFVASLYIFALVSFLIGGMNLFKYLQFELGGQEALMVLEDKALQLPKGGYDVHLIDVVYVTPDEKIEVAKKRLTGDKARALIGGKDINLIFLTNDPHTVIYSKNDLPNPWAWLVVGVLVLIVALYAHKLLRKETSLTTSVSSDDARKLEST